MKRYQNCVFDLYGTLVDIRTDEHSPRLWESMARWYREHGADYRPETLQDSYFAIVRQLEHEAEYPPGNDRVAHPEIRLERVFLRLFRDRNVPASEALAVRAGEHFRRCSLEYIRLYDGAEELLRSLRANGQGVWLLSNAQRIFTMNELRSLGLEPYFDGVYLSSDYGVKKPDQRFFQQLLRERGIRPESAVMIGNDGVCDIRGARDAGLSTVYIRSNISPREPLPDADYVLERMDLARVREILTQDGKRAPGSTGALEGCQKNGVFDSQT